MIEHLCPKCGKISYSADEHRFSPCPYCGFRFSGKYGSDRRREERYKKEAIIVLNYQGRHIEARSTDFSKEGMGIKVLGETPLGMGETVEISASDLHIKAKVMWVNKLPNISLVGLQRNLGVPRTS
jgi:DNA-directed RNA polymerase subunit RPC12/RpoP